MIKAFDTRWPGGSNVRNRLSMISEYSLDLHSDDEGPVAIVSVTGEIDLTNAGELEARLDELAADRLGLVLDLNAVTFVDSAALHVLFRVARRLGRERFGIAVAPTAVVWRAIEVVQLSKFATVRESADDCVSAVALPS